MACVSHREDLLPRLDKEALADTMEILRRNTVSLVTDSSTLGGAKAVIGYNLTPGARSWGGTTSQDVSLWTLEYPGKARQVIRHAPGW